MTLLLLVRHGETDWNVSQRFQGHTDVPLNEKGRQQAAAIAQRLASEEIHAIYTSDLSRARDTAVEIAEFHQNEISADPRLREGDFGEWEGATYDEIQNNYPELVKAWHEDLVNFAPPAGETPHQLAERVASLYEEIKTKHQDETAILVAHGGSLQILLCIMLNIPIGKFWQFNLAPCSLSQVSVYEEGAIINLLNDTSYLTLNLER